MRTTRKTLLQLALADTPGFVLDERELQRPGPSYMVDTLESLRADYPTTTLCLIIGMDAFAGFAELAPLAGNIAPLPSGGDHAAGF